MNISPARALLAHRPGCGFKLACCDVLCSTEEDEDEDPCISAAPRHQELMLPWQLLITATRRNGSGT